MLKGPAMHYARQPRNVLEVGNRHNVNKSRQLPVDTASERRDAASCGKLAQKLLDPGHFLDVLEMPPLHLANLFPLSACSVDVVRDLLDVGPRLGNRNWLRRGFRFWNPVLCELGGLGSGVRLWLSLGLHLRRSGRAPLPVDPVQLFAELFYLLLDSLLHKQVLIIQVRAETAELYLFFSKLLFVVLDRGWGEVHVAGFPAKE
mmetsp:Transcript_24769/g.69093  ORF Transcript_24769/g.69093 Transcript_24769/m.69093 type:complete len:203 (+) Transcript_24769:28-636(+)